MNSKLSQNTVIDDNGRMHIEDDWHAGALPENAEFAAMSYPDTSYSFANFFSKVRSGLRFGFATGNYGRSKFIAGENGQINIGKFVVLEATNIICNVSVTIKDHCMFSWGSVITDSWITEATKNPAVRIQMLVALAHSPNRHLEFTDPQPVIIEENVWVGFDAIILPGITIGRGAVIGCKSVVTENVPPYAVVVGNPARIVKSLKADDSLEVKQEALFFFNATPYNENEI